MTAERYWEGRWRDEYRANQRLVAALKLIAAMKDKTLLFGAYRDELSMYHEMGASKAFNQAAEIAVAALKDNDAPINGGD